MKRMTDIITRAQEAGIGAGLAAANPIADRLTITQAEKVYEGIARGDWASAVPGGNWTPAQRSEVARQLGLLDDEQCAALAVEDAKISAARAIIAAEQAVIEAARAAAETIIDAGRHNTKAALGAYRGGAHAAFTDRIKQAAELLLLPTRCDAYRAGYHRGTTTDLDRGAELLADYGDNDWADSVDVPDQHAGDANEYAHGLFDALATAQEGKRTHERAPYEWLHTAFGQWEW
jgi:hypothetical protein